MKEIYVSFKNVVYTVTVIHNLSLMTVQNRLKFRLIFVVVDRMVNASARFDQGGFVMTKYFIDTLGIPTSGKLPRAKSSDETGTEFSTRSGNKSQNCFLFLWK